MSRPIPRRRFRTQTESARSRPAYPVFRAHYESRHRALARLGRNPSSAPVPQRFGTNPTESRRRRCRVFASGLRWR